MSADIIEVQMLGSIQCIAHLTSFIFQGHCYHYINIYHVSSLPLLIFSCHLSQILPIETAIMHLCWFSRAQARSAVSLPLETNTFLQMPGLFQQCVTINRFLISIKYTPLIYTKLPQIAHVCLPHFDSSKKDVAHQS